MRIGRDSDTSSCAAPASRPSRRAGRQGVAGGKAAAVDRPVGVARRVSSPEAQRHIRHGAEPGDERRHGVARIEMRFLREIEAVAKRSARSGSIRDGLDILEFVRAAFEIDELGRSSRRRDDEVPLIVATGNVRVQNASASMPSVVTIGSAAFALAPRRDHAAGVARAAVPGASRRGRTATPRRRAVRVRRPSRVPRRRRR